MHHRAPSWNDLTSDDFLMEESLLEVGHGLTLLSCFVTPRHRMLESIGRENCANALQWYRDFDQTLARNIFAALGETSCIQICGRRIPSAWRILSRVKTLHVFSTKLEIENMRVLLDPRMSCALRQNDETFL